MLIQMISETSEINTSLELGPNGDLYGPLTLIFAVHLKLAPMLASELGVEVERGDAGHWVFKGMPSLSDLLDSLRETAAMAIEALDEDALRRFGYRVTDVFKRVVATGEDQQQANARLYAERVGLRSADQLPAFGVLQVEPSADAEPSPPIETATAINLGNVTSALQSDFAAGGFLIQAGQLLLLFIAEVKALDLMHLVSTTPEGEVYCDLSLLYLVDSRWRRSIGEHLCLPASEASVRLSEARAATITLDCLRKLGLARVEAMEELSKASRGFGILEPVLESAKSGESLEQAVARLHHLHQGLRPVK